MGSFIHVYTDGGGIRECKVPDDFSGMGSLPFVLNFPDFRKSLLASLAASSTASRTSNIVTVTATAHGIPTGSTYVGFRFFYPGSPSLTAGWYDSIVSIPDANTITFNAPGANFSSESINGGAAYTTLTTICSMTIPAGYLKPYSRLTSVLFRSGDTTATVKNIRNILAGSQMGLSGASTTPHGTHRVSIALDESKAYSSGSQDQTLSNTLPIINLDPSIAQTFALQGSVAAASGFLTLIECALEIVK